MAEQPHRLECSSDAGSAHPVGLRPGDVGAVEPQPSRLNRDQTRDHAEQRRLARPVGTDEAAHDTAWHGQRHTVDSAHRPEGDGDILDIEQGLSHCHRKASPFTEDFLRTLSTSDFRNLPSAPSNPSGAYVAMNTIATPYTIGQ